MRGKTLLDLHERICPVCKKEFIGSQTWVYKKTSGNCEKVFCSWGCLRRYENGLPSRAERRDRIIQAINDGLNDAEIAMLLNESRGRVYYWRKKLEGKNNAAKETENDGGRTDERETEPETGGGSH